MKFTSSLFALAVISAEAVDKRDFFPRSLHDVKSIPRPETHPRTAHHNVQSIRTGGEPRTYRHELDTDLKILDSDDCIAFVDRMGGKYPELFDENIADPTLSVCNTVAFELVLEHYGAGLDVVAEVGEPEACINAFTSAMHWWIKHLGELLLDEQFCSYDETLASDACSDLELTDHELDLLQPFTDEEVTDICTDGEFQLVEDAYEEALGGPTETNPCKFAFKQGLVDQQFHFIELASVNEACQRATQARATCCFITCIWGSYSCK